jgi:zinc protease
MKGLFFMTLLFCALGAAVTPNISFAKGIFPYNYQEKTLDNKLKVILVPMESKGLVSYYSIVRTGSRDEYEPGHTGFAHFFEHMMFRGTKNHPGDVYDKMMTEMGADANAYTTDDYTCYHLKFAKEDLDTVMKLEADRFKNLWYEEQAFKTEAGAVHGEYLKSLSSPYQHLFEKMMATAFTDHTYRHTTIGFKDDIEAMPTMYEYSLNFHKRYYRPENVILVIAGDINPEQTLDQIKNYYSDWKTGYVSPQIPTEPEQTMERKTSVKFPGRTLPVVAISYKGLAFDATNKALVSNMLFGSLAFGETSDIYKKLVINEQRVQFLQADVGENRDPSLMTIFTMVKSEDDINNVINEIDVTIAKYQNEPFKKEKVDKELNRTKYGFLMGLDTPDAVAGNLARYVAITGGISAIDDLFATMSIVTPDDIQKAARDYFVKDKRTVVVLKGGK